ncbi:hypothetical protein PV783_13985 [Chitinophaga sp. CC14]|uniref:hypothetical protein n=1 Tax=Chitinophaga sp. CC14 TaxID=3029199 RepID=UPI003B794832
MNKEQYKALLVTGEISVMHMLHTAIKDLLWDAGTDYVKLLSPLVPAVTGRLASLIMATDGFSSQDPEHKLVEELRDRVMAVVKETACSFVQVQYGKPGQL